MPLPSPFVPVKNPYRSGSQLAEIFSFLQTGHPRTLQRIGTSLGSSVIFPGALRLRNKRIASALRTIRNQPNGVDIVYNKAAKTYLMVEELS